MHRFVAAVAVGLSAVAIAGCGSGSGAATCAQFNAMDSDGKRAEVAAVLKDRNARNSSDTEVRGKVDTVVGSCAPDSQRDKLVKDLLP
ncbi:MAG: hypothetical protein ABW137_34805 [Mycobacterium sp.]